MKIEDYIYVMKDRVSSTLCDEILNEYIPTNEWRKGTIGEEGVYEEIRKCESIFMSHENVMGVNLKTRKRLDQDVFKSVSTCMQEYLTKFATFRCNIERDSGYSLLRYKTGDYIGQHIDASGRSPRELSCSISLNDEYEGGGFSFFDKKLKFDLGKGDVIMFPSNFMYPHEILPVTSGTRYAIITWIC